MNEKDCHGLQNGDDAIDDVADRIDRTQQEINHQVVFQQNWMMEYFGKNWM